MSHPVHPDLLPAGVSAIQLADGVPALTFEHEFCRATLSLQGGQLLDFTPAGGQPLLYLSPAANLAPGKAIRGGAPLCWPWFGKHPSDASRPQHGVARTALWTVNAIARREDGFHVKLNGPRDGDLTASLTLSLGRELVITLTTRNEGRETRQLSQALHSYIALGDLRQSALHGLAGVAYQDKLDGGDKIWPDAGWTPQGPVDAIALAAPTLQLTDSLWQRRLTIESEGSASTVVWTPWVSGAASMADMPDDGWQHFLCIEAANAASDSRTLAPGEAHSLTQRLRADAL